MSKITVKIISNFATSYVEIKNHLNKKKYIIATYFDFKQDRFGR